MNIKIEDIVLSKENPRSSVHKSNGSLASLKDSIRKFGVRVPIIVRKHPTVAGKYELRAGERRYFASKELELDTIPANVMELDDAEAMETTAVENSERVNLTVMEQVKQSILLADAYGTDAKAIADKMNMTPQQVKLRQNIGKNLCANWIKAVEDPDGDYGQLTAEHLDLIARLPKQVQEWMRHNSRALEDRDNKPLSVAGLDKWIRTDLAQALVTAPWDLDLKFGGKACSKCKERSDNKGQTELWDVETTEEKSPALCLNALCWHAKMDAAMISAVRKAKVDHPKLVAVQPMRREWKAEQALAKAIGQAHVPSWPLPTYEGWTQCKESDKSAEPVMLTNGPDAGKIKWVCKAKAANKSTATAKTDSKPVVKTMAVRRNELRGLRLKPVYVKLKEAVLACDEPEGITLQWAAAVAAVYETKSSFVFPKHRNKTNDQMCEILKAGTIVTVGNDLDSKEQWEADLAGVLWLKSRENFAQEIPFGPNGEQALAAEKQCRAVAKLVRFDFDKALKDAETEKPDPKSWAKLKEDGTPR